MLERKKHKHKRELVQIGLGQIFGQALVQIDFCPNWSFGLAQVGIGQMKDTTHEPVLTTCLNDTQSCLSEGHEGRDGEVLPAPKAKEAAVDFVESPC